MFLSRPAPTWHVSRWFNTRPLTLPDLHGRIVVAHAFQMLCPGCATRALPQMQQVHDAFPADKLVVVGLHTVFEHHAEQNPQALQAFLYEYRYTFPVGVDTPSEDYPLPQTMRAYQMEGTPTLLLIDAMGNLREQHFGNVGDLALGAAIGRLLAEAERDADDSATAT